MKSFKEGISHFAWNSLNSKPAKSDRSSRKRKLQLSSQPDIDAIDSSDSCHSDSSCDVITIKRSCPTVITGHHFIPTPYAKALAESISEFEASSESEGDECCLDDVNCNLDDCGNDTNNLKSDSCQGDSNISEHHHGISDSQSISSAASSPDVCTANQITTGDWLKGVVMTTPDSKAVTPVKGSSSGRGSKIPRRRISFVKCGLAEQLSRLLSQQRSEKAFWHHQMLRQHCHGVPSGSLAVKVIGVAASHCLIIVQALVIQGAGLEHPHKGEVVTIVFDSDAMKVLKLQPGSFVSICPPWQSITIRGSHLVLLSTHFCLPFFPDELNSDHGIVTDIATTPVTNDHTGDEHLESACTHEESDHKDDLAGDKIQPCVEKASPESCTHEQKMMSLLEAMEQTHHGHISMAAKLQRVYRHKVSCRVAKQFSSGSLTDDFIQCAKNYHQHSSNIRWFFLMEDDQGVWSEVMINNDQVICSREWRQLVSRGEGGQCHFTDLRVVARTTKATNPDTFSLISSILDTEQSTRVVKFCYQLFATPTATVKQADFEGASAHVILQDLTEPHPLRVTIFGQVIHHTAELNNRLLMITTNSNKVVTVIIKPGCVLDRHLAIANGSYLFIRDAATKPGDVTAVHCDGCSFVILTDQYGDLLHHSLCPKIPCKVGKVPQPCVSQLTEATCSVGKLVSVKGTVVAVDEDNATYLPVCDACGGHLSESKESDKLYCAKCQITVKNPGITVELAVFMIPVGLPLYTLHVQLHKTTTSKLLPIDYSTAEQGLEVNQVLNQTLQMNACHISAIDDTMVHMQEVEL